MSMNRRWMSWVVSSLLTPLVSFKSNPLESKSAFLDAHVSMLALVLIALAPHFRWAQANMRKGQAGVEPKDVYGTRV